MEERFLQHIPRDDIYLFNTGEARKAWLCFGCVFVPELQMHRFLVWAPNAKSVTLVGDFNDWSWDATPLERIEGGVWAVFLDNVWDSQNYKYCIEGPDGRRVLKSDPFAAWAQNGIRNASLIWTEKDYPWGDADFLRQRAERSFMTSPMSIYEVHLGSWKDMDGCPTYRRLADELAAYCSDMGYTHVELMPVTEYPYDGSWGYQVTGYYAPTSRYGNPDDFKYFVDTLHRAGLGVIMDWVPAHFPKDAHGLAMFDGTPLFECKERRMAEHPEWGTLIFDYGSTQVQSFLISSACKFFDVYHIDGIRVDAVTSMLYLNYGRREGEFTPNEEGGSTNLNALRFLRKLNYAILTGYPGAVTIAEESTAFPLITAPPDMGGVGFCLKWDMGFMHDTIDYMSLDAWFRSFNHHKLTFSMMYAFSENYVLAYSHDEVVHGKYSMINKMAGDYELKFASLRALYGYQFGHPGKKLTFMGSEFGQFIEWNWQQGLDWLLLGYMKHAQLQQYMKALNKLYTSYPAMYAVDRSWEGFKWLNVDDAGRSSIAFLRSAAAQDSYVVCVCNFTPVKYEGFVFGLPGAGTLREILSSDDEQYGGEGNRNEGLIKSREEGFLDLPASAAITLPAMSTLFFEYRPATPAEKKAGKKPARKSVRKPAKKAERKGDAE